MQRKTLTQRLTLKYKLIVRNEENFADRWTLRFNFLGVLVFFTLSLILFYFTVTGVNRLGAYLLGTDESGETQLLINLASKLDSLEYELEVRDNYISNFKIMLDGGQISAKDTAFVKLEKKSEDKISPEEEAFREKFEKEVANPEFRSEEGFNLLYFTPPITGKTSPILQNKETIGISIMPNSKIPIRILDDGIVISIDTSLNSKKIVIQHTNGLVTIYRNLTFSVLKPNTLVSKGDIISASESQMLTFQMLYNGKILNPYSYIAWK